MKKLLLALIVLAFASTGALAAVASQTPLAQKMDVMSDALKDIAKPTATSNLTNDLKLLRDAATDCRDHSDDLAPAAVAADPNALVGFKAEFNLLLTQIDALEAAINLPADDATRAAKIQTALADIAAVKKDGHTKYKQQ